MGVSELTVDRPYMNELTMDENDATKGMHKADGVNVGNVYGSYVHGIFDCDNVAATIVAAGAKGKSSDATHELHLTCLVQYL